MTTLDGPTKLLAILRSIADDEDKLNALTGVGVVLRTGTVLTHTPTVTVVMDGESSMGGPMIFDQSKGDIVVPEDTLLARGDSVVMAPLSKRSWLVVSSIRGGGDPLYRGRLGFDGDRSGGSFSGVQIDV